MDNKVIIQKLATKYNLPLKKVENIVNSQFKFVAKKIRNGKFETIRLPYFGKFSVNENRLKHINKKNGSSNNK